MVLSCGSQGIIGQDKWFCLKLPWLHTHHTFRSFWDSSFAFGGPVPHVSNYQTCYSPGYVVSWISGLLLFSCVRFLYTHLVPRTGCGCFSGKLNGKCYSVLSLGQPWTEKLGGHWPRLSSRGQCKGGTKHSVVLEGNGLVKTRRKIGCLIPDPRFVPSRSAAQLTHGRLLFTQAQEAHRLWALRSSCSAWESSSGWEWIWGGV